MKNSEQTLLKNGNHKNSNSTFDVWNNDFIQNTWNSGFIGVDIICHDWGFQLFISHGRISPADLINFGQFFGENNLDNAYLRMIEFLNKNYKKSEALSVYLWGE